jgi:hypothetical protein
MSAIAKSGRRTLLSVNFGWQWHDGHISGHAGGMTRNMIYHNDFGWTLERRADGTHHRETLI